MIRGLTAVDEITPKFAAETLAPGGLNCVVLKALKNSVRNSRLAPSRNRLSAVRVCAPRCELRSVAGNTIDVVAVGSGQGQREA